MRYEPPRGWASLPLKRFLSGNDSGTWGDDPTGHGDTLVLRSTEQTADGRWCISDPAPRSLDPKERIRTRLRKGDLIITKSSGSPTHIGKTTLVEGPLAEAGYAFGNFMQRLRTRRALVPKFLWYVMQADMVRQQIPLVSTTTTGLANLNGTVLGSLVVLVPPHEEQSAIVDFLDRETEQIDELIEKQNRLVTLLRERRRVWHTSVLSHDSGWPRVALRHICHAIVDCPHWTPDVVEESEFEAVRSGCIREGQYRPEAALLVDEAVYHARNRGTSVEEGDVLFAREAPAGEACLVPVGRNLCLGQRTVLLKVDRTRIAPELVLANLYSQGVQDRFRVEMHGSTVGNLRLPVIRGTVIVVPPTSEQAGLVKDFVEGIARIDALIEKAEEFIVLAKERRAALITAAVTGQIDVIREAS